MYALLTALSLLFPHPDLSNHWRWASASFNQSTTTPIPSPVVPVPSPSPNPTPVPSPTPVLKPGDDCPGCTGGWIDSDGSAKVKCWKCNGDGRVDSGDPILTGSTEPLPGFLPESTGNRISEDLKQKKTEEASKGTSQTGEGTTEDGGKKHNLSSPATMDKKGNDVDGKLSNSVPEAKTTEEEAREAKQDTEETGIRNDSNGEPDQVDEAVQYEPKYSADGYWLWDLENKKWVRSAKQPPVYKEVKTGHYETKTYQEKVCNGRRGCKWVTRTKQVWVEDSSPQKVLQEAPARNSYYPVRSRWWTGCGSWKHLTTGPHAGKFDPEYLQKLSYEELQSLHSDHHEELRYGKPKVKWEYVNK